MYSSTMLATSCGGAVDEVSIEDFEQINAVSSTGTFLGMKHAIPAMRTQSQCSVINIFSVVGYVGAPGVFAYSAAKGAVRAMSRSAAVHLDDLGKLLPCRHGLSGRHHHLDDPESQSGGLAPSETWGTGRYRLHRLPPGLG